MGKTILAVASENPIKWSASKNSFQDVYFPEQAGILSEAVYFFKEVVDPHEIRVHGFDIPSGVSSQPMNEKETHRGAMNRMATLRATCPDADYYVSMEGGVIDHGQYMEEIGYVMVAERGSDDVFYAQVSRFEVPVETANLIRQGMEMGDANDRVFGKENSKQGGGMIGEVTNQLVPRERLYYNAAIIAWSSMNNKHLYKR